MHHITFSGDIGTCKAETPKACPYYMGADDTRHYATFDAAQAAIEDDNADDLFPDLNPLLVNTVDDGEDDNVPDIFADELTLEEDRAEYEMHEVERDILRHERLVSEGYEPYRLVELSQPNTSATGFIDPDKLKTAFDQCAYHDVRLLYADAHKRQLGSEPGTFRMTTEELARHSSETFDPDEFPEDQEAGASKVFDPPDW